MGGCIIDEPECEIKIMSEINSKPIECEKVFGGIRDENYNWKGGRVLASNGYILVKVGFNHHLADVRGYAYEHRVVAEKMIGRKLKDGEIVHHKDENKSNNSPENLEVVFGNAEHFLRHRKPGSKRRLPGCDNKIVLCACGCGESFDMYDSGGRPRKYISGHNGKMFMRELVLCYLENVPEPKTAEWISDMFDMNKHSIRNVLGELKKEGVVTRDAGKNGEWRIVE